MTAKLIVDGRAVNLSDEKGLRALCLLLFRGQSDYIDVLSKKLSKNMQISIYDQMRIYLILF